MVNFGSVLVLQMMRSPNDGKQKIQKTKLNDTPLYQLILQPCTRLDTENPYPIPELVLYELYHYKVFNGNHLSTMLLRLFISV